MALDSTKSPWPASFYSPLPADPRRRPKLGRGIPCGSWLDIVSAKDYKFFKAREPSLTMKPSFEDLKKLCPDIPDGLLRDHLERLGENYYDIFTLLQVVSHLRSLAGLRKEHPVDVLFEEGQGNAIACTVLAYDYPSEFSLITGVLSATGFNILSGNVFTYTHDKAGKRRMIIDRFGGVVQTGQSIEQWKSAFKSALNGIIARLEKGAPDCLAEARQSVNEMVAARLVRLKLSAESVLYPVNIEVSDAAGYTRLRVLSQDTPAFLYALSSALAFQSLSIEQVRISTVAGRVQDEIDILDARGAKISEDSRIDAIKLSVLLTKQFTYFLGSSPDPFTALGRFEKMLESVLSVPDRGEWIKLLSTPGALQDLARLLGASDFVWEDFIRLQYETLLPILKPSGAPRRFATPPEELKKNLRARLMVAEGFEDQCRGLNEFKDRELYLIDLEQILDANIDVKSFSRSLTRLAELVARTAAEIIFRNLRSRYGVPRTVAGIEAQWSIFGLGKFGGEAIGYASDIELLLVFSDNGRTDGTLPLENSEYFAQAARMLSEVIKAKLEGIFRVDIRLRPYGESGPMACSLESFCRYYGPNGPAHSYERLALVRLRAVAGDRELGGRIERLRDEFVYGARKIKPAELSELREKQIKEKTIAGRYNAKFSAGALVDLEYDIQLMQVMHGVANERLRTPRIHEALEALSELGVLSHEEGRRLASAYYFFRRLINGLRMLRGSARDLFLPPEGSLEFIHLARRMGYQRGGQLEPEQQLRVDFETWTAVVRAFIERHFGRESLPGKPDGNMVDLVISDSVPPALQERILSAVGFKNTDRAFLNLRKLGCGEARQDVFAPLAVLVGDILRQS
ncbi:MAG: glutamate-ammonia-ligase adenylyltransferase, partial [Kiritimatiellia bacterium]|nr:glutamate-ammonia-ligase adenylyltransferase [Kiritimatiellia bacterium]